MKRRLMIFVVVLTSACGGTTSAPTYVLPPVQYVTLNFNGVVLTDDGRPMPDATVSIARSGPSSLPVNATTDGSGSYKLALDLPASWAGVNSARITHPLYDDTVNINVSWVPGHTDVTKNFRLYRSIMAAGQSAHLAITRDNSNGGDNGEMFYRLVHVTVPSSGTLVVDAIADDPSNTFRVSIGDYPNYPVPTHVSRSIDTATTVVVMVAVCLNYCSESSMTGRFTLKTALAP